MKDKDKTKEQLINELAEMRQRITELEKSENRRKQTEETLRETQSYLENLLNYANAPIIVWDAEFKITRFNRAFERLTAKSVDKVLGKQLDILFPDDRREEAMAHIRRTMTGERWEAVEIPILRADGAIRTVLWNSATLYAADGKTVVATIAQGQDITERKQVEETLRKSEAKSRLILQTIPSGLFTVDKNRKITSFNKGAEQIIGLKADEVIGKNCLEAFDCDSFYDGCSIFDDKVDKPIYGKDSVIHAGGRIIIISKNMAILKDSEGNTIGGLESFVDITERVKTEETLRETQNYLENLLNYANAPIIVWDAEFRITRFNRAFERLTKKSADKVLGKRLNILFPDDRREEAMAHIQRTMTGERWEAVEINILRADGAVRTVLWNSATLYAADSKTVVATIAQGQDITERIQVEEERAKLIVELQNALAKVKTLRGLIPICASCKKVRDDEGYWHQVETYVHEHSEAEFTHGLCPECAKKLYPEFYKKDKE
ncbi:MAG: PAS domain S-box protein [Calditrichales bacterium]|nr:PAS domain S-box protein [Calditrichales bacterium]